MPTLALPPFPARVDRRLVLVGLLLAAVAVAFWTGSRYPALDAKALMGGSADVAGISFDRLVAVDPEAPGVIRAGANLVNWAYTNKQGMAFGLLFAALVLTALPLVSRKRFEGRMANTLLGVAMGAPLGVCVNCAVPVAEGLHQGGARPETTVAALMSSPTLNAVVLGMTFALFPVWLAGVKVGLTLAFVVLAVPLVVRALWRAEAPATDAFALPGPSLPAAPALAAALDADLAPTTWRGAAGWTVRALARNLGYILKTTVPLMVLAGVLGAIVVTALPWEALAEGLPAIEPRRAPVRTLAALALVAALGTFLPVPIAFDVVICAILAAMGVPLGYVAALLVTLGIFSVYPMLQMSRTMSRPTALGLFAAVTALGVVAGLGADVLEARAAARAEATVAALLLEDPPPPLTRPAFPTVAVSAEAVGALGIAPLEPEPVPGVWPVGIAVSRVPFAPAEGGPGLRFTRIAGPDLGLRAPDNLSFHRTERGRGYNRAAAAADVHGDGWPDLAFTSEAGVELWANVGGERFVRQEVAVPALEGLYVTGVALVDLDGDAAPDLFVTTDDGGEHAVYNDGGAFTASGHRTLLRPEGAAPVLAAGFGDVDGDGDLDAVVGRGIGPDVGFAVGGGPTAISPEAARNTLLLNDGAGGFSLRPLPAPPAETLTALLADLDGDGDLDLVVGNDFNPTDVVYDGDGAGGFERVPYGAGRIPKTGMFTMSAAAADLDNDLHPELFLAQISEPPIPGRPSPSVICAGLADDERVWCERGYAAHAAGSRAALTDRSPTPCLALPTATERADCGAVYRAAREYFKRSRVPRDCSPLEVAPRWATLAADCRALAARPARATPEELARWIPAQFSGHVLLRRDGPGPYSEIAEVAGIRQTGWTWNARFFDADHDGFQDLFAVNGWLGAHARERNVLLRNTGGGRFEDATEAAGVGSWLDTYAYLAVDYDRDGDLDLVVPSAAGPIEVFRNDTTSPALQLVLDDATSANRAAIGAVVVVRHGDGRAQMREVQASGGFRSFDEPVVHFGLGGDAAAASVEVRWPTGETTALLGSLAAGARYVVTRRAR